MSMQPMHKQAAAAQSGSENSIEPVSSVASALAWAAERANDEAGRSGEGHVEHARATIEILRSLGADEPSQTAMALVAPAERLPLREIESRFGGEVARLVDGMRQIQRLRELHAQAGAGQSETLRKMLLAMATDIRVVLIRLASRLRTLRYHASLRAVPDVAVARETLDVLAPLANRLGLWQLKWELEDLAFRFVEPEAYRALARELEQRRAEREAFVAQAKQKLRGALEAAGIRAELSGRPKHIHSIHEKMRRKQRTLEQISDLHALRAIVDTVAQCYATLDVVHGLWRQVPEEYDDYIARPKPNGYRSLHTVVVADGGRLLEVQIRTHEMHRHAEYGIASHWQYKERGTSVPDAAREQAGDAERIAWMRQLLAWQSDVGRSLDAQAPGSAAQADAASGAAGGAAPGATADAIPGATPEAEQRIYVLTPQARVIELPAGSTPIDFAYHVHTTLGHRCRGARVDGHLVPLNTPLRNAQTVEVIAAREGGHDGPSRDWLNPQLGYVRSPRARTKVRQWFNALELERETTTGRERVERILQREGRTALSLDELARRLGFDATGSLFVAVAREEIGPRQIEEAVRQGQRSQPASGQGAGGTAGGVAGSSGQPGAVGSAAGSIGLPAAGIEPTTLVTRLRRPSDATGRGDGVLVVGIDSLMTQLARCCRPIPPDPIAGFVTKGRGVSIHRESCTAYAKLVTQAPERVIEATWSEAALRDDGEGRARRFPVDVEFRVSERPALLRDITEILARERVNVLAMQTLARQPLTSIRVTLEVRDAAHLARTLAAVREVTGVVYAGRR
ncbi:MAG: bifunctional (p)ppGpp synthetase/guanosine-3',5'-bis(diphosphate) 3'-pyrophosphohydrolase [Burkholderiaceae bacterium]|nr:bifunctional (p)ppGpp synthetase/guanosine-3',5'-bis(diphosphate) 3'-pyrophosphohydrolase [Burkholderiaceae bacterium]